jgi:hypothetical protein
VFSTYLYTGNGATYDTIVNGIDLSGKGGLVWTKSRSAVEDHRLEDTVRGAGNKVSSNLTAAQTAGGVVGQFNNNGFTVFGNTSVTYASWTFREQPNFLDVVTTTISGTTAVFNHNLGSTPGFVIVKKTSGVEDWACWHRSFSNTTNDFLLLNTTDPVASVSNVWSVNSTSVTINYRSAGSYVAYIFAHNAGGFGLTGTDNVISCGSFSTGSGSPSITLGYEPQWLLFKSSSGTTSSWYMFDNMRGWSQLNAQGNAQGLFANTSGAEFTTGNSSIGCCITSTGVSFVNFFNPSQTWIYVAIRRGPMKVPTVGTSVFKSDTFTGSNSVNKSISTNFNVDMTWGRAINASVSTEVFDRLRGATQRLVTNATDSEVNAQASNFDVSNGITLLAGYNLNYSTLNFINYTFGRAPGFFDEVCYTGTGSATTQTHNLGAVPELIIVKSRSNSQNWFVYSGNLGNTIGTILNLTNASGDYGSALWNSTTPTSSVFSLGTNVNVNNSGSTYVAYLFATCVGVSKVGSYSGTGATQTIDCGFTGGARFVLIKRTDSTGDWYVWDTARGMVAGTDPSLLMNSSAAQVNANSVYTTGVGFQIVSTAAGINASGGTYIFLAVA